MNTTNIIQSEKIELSNATLNSCSFNNCNSICEVRLSNCILNADNIFSNCSCLTSIEIFDCTINTTTTSAFCNCAYLKHIKITNNSYNYIHPYAFDGCLRLYNSGIDIVSWNSITGIGEYAFRNTGLNTFNIPESLSYVGKGIISNTEISSVYIPKTFNDVNSIQNFLVGDNLLSVHIDDQNISVTNTSKTGYTSDYHVFNKSTYELMWTSPLCSFVTNNVLCIPDFITSVKSDFFSKYSDITAIYIPASLTGNIYHLNGCNKLKRIHVASGNSRYSDCNSNCIYDYNSAKLVVACENTYFGDDYRLKIKRWDNPFNGRTANTLFLNYEEDLSKISNWTICDYLAYTYVKNLYINSAQRLDEDATCYFREAINFANTKLISAKKAKTYDRFSNIEKLVLGPVSAMYYNSDNSFTQLDFTRLSNADFDNYLLSASYDQFRCIISPTSFKPDIFRLIKDNGWNIAKIDETNDISVFSNGMLNQKCLYLKHDYTQDNDLSNTVKINTNGDKGCIYIYTDRPFYATNILNLTSKDGIVGNNYIDNSQRCKITKIVYSDETILNSKIA